MDMVDHEEYITAMSLGYLWISRQDVRPNHLKYT